MATPNTVIDLTGVIGIVDVTYDALTDTLTIIYEDETTKDIILNDVSVNSVVLSGTDLIITKSDGTVYTESLATFVQAQADWNQADTGAADFIKNKPATESNLADVASATQVAISNDNGTGVILDAADTNNAGVMTADMYDLLMSLDETGEANVQADWDETDTLLDAFIKNKPATESNLAVTTTGAVANVTNDNGTGLTIPGATATDAGLMTSAVFNKIALINELAEVNVQGDWDEVDALADSFIKNKPDFDNIPLNVAYTPATDTLSVTFTGGVTVDYVLNDVQVETAAYDLLNEKIVLTKTDFSTVDIDMAQLVNYMDTTFALAADLGQPNGIATLDALGHVPASQVPFPVTERIDVFATVALQTTFTVDYNPDDVDVFVGGILLQRTEFTATNGTSVELVSGVDAGTWMLVKTTPTY